MNFRDAVKQSVMGYYKGNLPEKSIESSEKEFIYTLDYFEELEAEGAEMKTEKDKK